MFKNKYWYILKINRVKRCKLKSELFKDLLKYSTDLSKVLRI